MTVGEVETPERPVSRVLSWAIIHLGPLSPVASSNLPGSPLGTGGAAEATYSPIWSCSGRGLPCRERLPVARCALTAPFHPYQPKLAVYFLWHFPWAHAPQALPGALSEGARTFLCKQELTAIAWPTPTLPGAILPQITLHKAKNWQLVVAASGVGCKLEDARIKCILLFTRQSCSYGRGRFCRQMGT